MTTTSRRARLRQLTRLLLATGLAASVAGCASTSTKIPTGTSQPDKYLLDHGTESLNKKQWLRAREYFRELWDGYPQSSYRTESKLGLGDAYLGEGSPEALVLALNEFREFLTYYPTSKRADYAQYKVGMCHFKQMSHAERDQSQTREAVAEFEVFLERFPDSPLAPEVKARMREARDRLGESEYRVGLFYYRVRWYVGAVDRFVTLLKSDPGFTNRDAVYYYLAESLVKVQRPAEALPYYDRLVKEFAKSEFLDRAKQRIEELKNAPATPPAAPVKK